jgi:hypothetical protein
MRDAVAGLARQMGRPTISAERQRAVLHSARHDAFIDPSKAIGD